MEKVLQALIMWSWCFPIACLLVEAFRFWNEKERKNNMVCIWSIAGNFNNKIGCTGEIKYLPKECYEYKFCPYCGKPVSIRKNDKRYRGLFG